MERLKIFLNHLLHTTGYTLSRFDKSGYSYRDDLYKKVLDNYSPSIHGSMLDIGSQYGSWAKEKLATYGKVTTTDKLGGADIIGDVLRMPFADNTFDCVFCFETIEHVENPFTAIKEIYRVLKPGGIFIGSTPFMYELHGEEYGDYWRLTRQAWELLLKDFKDAEVVPFGMYAPTPHHYMVKGKK